MTQGVIQSHFPSHLQVYLDLGGQYHKCVPPLMELQYPYHS